jgi:hypothetical protein
MALPMSEPGRDLATRCQIALGNDFQKEFRAAYPRMQKDCCINNKYLLLLQYPLIFANQVITGLLQVRKNFFYASCPHTP